MLHRLLFAFTLILSFGMAQMGVVTHEISHYTNPAATDQQQNFNKNSSKHSQNDQTPHGQVCEKCVSYAEIGSAIPSTHIALALTVTARPHTSASLQSSSHAKPLTYQARAPPTFA